jgi:membrane-associated protease RseP (regulator of RpoE activity)
MLGKRRLSKLLAISACLLIPATVAGFWALSTNTSLAGDEDTSLAWTMLSTSGSTGFLGVELEEETEHPEGGARIERVVEDSAADEAGLEEGDIIVAFDGHTIRGPKAVTKRMQDLDPGDTVSITVVRDGRTRSFDVELGERTGLGFLRVGDDDVALVAPKLHDWFVCDDDDDCSFSWSCTGDDCDHVMVDVGRFFGRRPMLGVQLVHVTDELREHLGGEAGTGTLVSKVVAGSPAEDAGVEVGDLIVAVDGEPVADAGDIRGALEDKEGETFDVEVIRDGRPVSLEVTIPERDDERPSGPRAFHVAPRIDLHGLRREIDRARDEARDAWRDSREAYREALAAVRVTRRDAARQAREAYREAVRQSREARRKSLDRLNSI